MLLRSGGECESCKEPASFERVDGSPYLEAHHTTRVSDGGLDHPRSLVRSARPALARFITASKVIEKLIAWGKNNRNKAGVEKTSWATVITTCFTTPILRATKGLPTG